MVSSSSNPQRKFKPAKRDSLYFGQFRYSALFFIREASALRKLDAASIDQTVFFRNAWRMQVSDADHKNLHQACAQLNSLKNPFKTSISHNWMYFYTNDLADIDQLSAGPLRLRGHIAEAVITHSKDTVGLKFPKHQFRTYVKSHRPEPHQRESLSSFIEHNSDEIRVSPGLRDFLKSKSQLWLHNGYFIDHNDMRIVTALALISPKLIRKTMPIVKVNS